MSADNWSICPRCQLNARKAYEKRLHAVDSTYGKVPAAEYNRLLSNIKSCEEMESTLREDYELGISDTGEFKASYWACCARCKFKFSFTHTEQVDIDKT